MHSPKKPGLHKITYVVPDKDKSEGRISVHEPPIFEIDSERGEVDVYGQGYKKQI